MNSGKSIALLMVHHNYASKGRGTVLFSHKIDTRFGESVIASRLGMSAPSIAIDGSVNLFEMVKAEVEAGEDVACVLCDEVQFYTVEQIDQLSDIVDFLRIPVIAYGLKISAFGELFDASKRLIELADEMEDLRHVCWCSKRANMILRHDSDGNVVKSGALVEVGAESMYRSVCRKHWKLGIYEDPDVSH